jgi:hypothetical protein
VRGGSKVSITSRERRLNWTEDSIVARATRIYGLALFRAKAHGYTQVVANATEQLQFDELKKLAALTADNSTFSIRPGVAAVKSPYQARRVNGPA